MGALALVDLAPAVGHLGPYGHPTEVTAAPSTPTPTEEGPGQLPDMGHGTSTASRVVLTERTKYACRMLIQPQYLNEGMLASFLASVEGGVRQTLSSRTSESQEGRGAVGAGLLKAEGHLSGQQETAYTYEDHAVARLQRLISAGQSQPEQLAWIEVCNPDNDLPGTGTGAVLHWECDVYIPDFINALSNPEMKNALQLVESLVPHANTFGLDTNGLPAPETLSALGSALRNFDVAPVVIGEDVDTDWKIVGSLIREHIIDSAEFDNRVRIVAKVKREVNKGKWYSLAPLAGTKLLNRQRKRELEQRGPQKGEEDQFLQGPLLEVDYLAIYT